jgi:hypothetical protein
MICSRLRYSAAVALYALTVLCPIRVCAATEGENAEQSGGAAVSGSGNYDQFLYLRHNNTNGTSYTDSLVLAKATAKGFEQRDVLTLSGLHINWKPLCVRNGVLYAMNNSALIAVDLSAGKAENILSNYGAFTSEANMLYMLVNGEGEKSVLRLFDFAKRCCRDAATVDLGSITWHNRPIRVSPDSNKLATFAYANDVKGAAVILANVGASKLQLIDLRTGKINTIGPEVYSLTYSTGGGFYDYGPPFLWIDQRTILLVCKGPNLQDADLKAATLDVETGITTDIVNLPRRTWQFHEPYFSPPGKDGAARIVMGELGQYRIDVKQKQIVEDNSVGGDFLYTRGRKPERLHHGQSLLAEGDKISDLSLSPDGLRAVWWMGRNPSATMSYYDAREGKVREVTRAWFPILSSSSELPDGRNTIFWVSAKDMAPTAPADTPQGWRPWTTGPYPKPPSQTVEDKRPKVTDLFTLRVSTDKKVYKLHNPIEIALELTNKTGRDVSFHRPKNMFPFFRVTMRSNRLNGTLTAFERNEELFSSDPVVVKAGETLRVSATAETEAVGDHKIEASMRSDEWQGELNAEPLTCVVEHSPEDASLFKVKFLRLITLCRAEFEKDPMTCDYGRLLILGPEMIPLLVAELDASDNPAYRQRMGYAMQRMATADALPYLEKLLRGDMNSDREMVIVSLQGMIQRKVGVEGALSLLIMASKHQNASVRRDAVDRLRRIDDPNVKDAMEIAVEDKDDQIAMMAARYLAAYARIDLAAWLSAAAEKPTHAQYLAGQSIVKELERTWKINEGQLPTASWEETIISPEAADSFRRTLLLWQSWAKENQRSSEHFFDDDRKEWKIGIPGRN